MIESYIPDVLRLCGVGIVGSIAYRNYKNRSVELYMWFGLFGIAGLAIAIDLFGVATHAPKPIFGSLLFSIFIGVAIFSFFVIMGVYTGWFGYDDGGVLLAIPLLYPSVPSYPIPISIPGPDVVPLVFNAAGLFSVDIFINIIIIGIFFHIFLGVYNAIRGNISAKMFTTVNVPTSEMEQFSGSIRLGGEPEPKVVKVSTLRSYLDWKDTTAENISPTDKTGLRTDGDPAADSDNTYPDDPWDAMYFCQNELSNENIPPSVIREALDRIASRQSIQISPPIPYAVAIVVGILTTILIGNMFIFISVILG